MKLNLAPGDKIRDLVIVKELPQNRYVRIFVFKCFCGNIFTARLPNVRSGNTSSCGCLKKQAALKRRTSHGLSHIPEYRIWEAMRRRCSKPSDKRYPRYGGRGIKVCQRWQKSFSNFLDDIGYRPSPFHWLERIDNDGNYCPKNCTWVPSAQQAANKSNTRKITFNGETHPISHWANRLGIKKATLWARLNRGWSIEKSFNI